MLADGSVPEFVGRQSDGMDRESDYRTVMGLVYKAVRRAFVELDKFTFVRWTD